MNRRTITQVQLTSAVKNFSDDQTKDEGTPAPETKVGTDDKAEPSMRDRLAKALKAEFGDECVAQDDSGKLTVTCVDDTMDFSEDDTEEIEDDSIEDQEYESEEGEVPEALHDMSDDELAQNLAGSVDQMENLSDEIEANHAAGEDISDLQDQYADAEADASNFSRVLISRGLQINFSEDGSALEISEPELVTADQGQMPVLVDDIPHVPVTDLEVGDKVVTPFGDEAVVIENPMPGDVEVKLAVPSEGTCIEVPIEELKNFCVKVSCRKLVNFSEVKEDDAAPATTKEVEAISKNEIDKQKDDIAGQAANQVMAAVAPQGSQETDGSQEAPSENLSAEPSAQDAASNGEAPTEGKVEDGATEPESKEANEPAPEADEGQPEEGQANPEDQSEGKQVNHSRMMSRQQSPTTRQTNFSRNTYSGTLASLHRLGKSSL